MRVGGGRCCSARGWIFKVIRENRWFCVLHFVHFSRILILWQALSLKKQIRGGNWKGYHRVFFCAMTDTSGKVKDVSVICCRLHWEWSCLWTFSHRERLTRTDLTEWLASCLPLLYLSSDVSFFSKIHFLCFPVYCFSCCCCCWCLWLISTKKVDGGCPWVIINEAKHFVWWTF